jgi:death-on-curing protein
MERTGWNVKHLTEDVICDINRRMIERYGGKPYNLADRNQANRASLLYILEAIQYPIFGQDMYPTLVEKAAALGWTIVTKHVFHDGCKRTGMMAIWEFLEVNGVRVSWGVNEAKEIMKAVAEGKATYDDFLAWLRSQCLPNPSD